MSTTLERLHALVDQLPPGNQERALEVMQELVNAEPSQSDLPPGTSGSSLRNVRFSMSYEEAESMKRAIMEDRERSIHDEE